MRTKILTVAVMLLAGCSNAYEPKLKVGSLENEAVLSGTGSIGVTIIQDPKNLRKVCMGRGVEAAFDQSDSGSISVSLVSIGKSDSDSASNAEKSGEEEMVGRTPAVLITRELFYRACELTVNANLDSKDALELFYKVLNVVDDGWKREGGNTTVKIGDTINNQSANSNNLTGAAPIAVSATGAPAAAPTTSTGTQSDATDAGSSTFSDGTQDTSTSSDGS
jgi:hypothetical protein